MQRPENVLMRVAPNKEVELVWGGKVADWSKSLGGFYNKTLWDDLILKMSPYTTRKLDPAPFIQGKEFYGKAHVYSHDDQFVQVRLLKSYETFLAVYSKDLSLGLSYLRVRGYEWSQTTTRHIQSFVHENGMTPMVNSLLDKFKGGYANRLGQVGDIVVIRADELVVDAEGKVPYEIWYENAKEENS